MKLKTLIYGFCLVSALMIAGTMALFYNLDPMFDIVDRSINDNMTVVMNGNVDADKLETMLLRGDYIGDETDAKLISRWIKSRIEEGPALENLGVLNTDRFKIPADTVAAFGGTGLMGRLNTHNIEIGLDEEWNILEPNKERPLQFEKDVPKALIRVHVNQYVDKENKKTQNAPGISVRITEHMIDSTTITTDVANLDVSHISRTLGYLKTDNQGNVEFEVPTGRYYSVLPIAEGYEFGPEKGTTDGPLVSDMEEPFNFVRKVSSIKPFNTETYNRLKKDFALISRTPADFKDTVKTDIAIFLICWLIVFIVIGYNDKKQGKSSDPLILLTLMILTGAGLLTLYGQMRPLTDIFYAHKMIDITSLSLNNFSGGIVLGCALLVLLSCVDYLKVYQKYRSKWASKMKIGGSWLSSIAPALPFMLIAIILMLMLRFFGSAPEGSDAKVNLFGFQPSEVVKYFIVIFLAFFFVAKGDVIKTYGMRMTRLARRRYISIIGGVVLIIGVISLLFLAMLKDMGPGIVVLVTFILMYSVVRRDVPQLLTGIISFMVLVGLAYMLTDVVALRIMVILAWFILWIVYNWWKNHTVYESAIFFNTIVSLFLVGGYLLQPFLPHMAERLFNRTNMAWSGIFDNAIHQGDQIAQGLWGTAAGGFSGMGIGGGSSYFIPAGHTDLILNSLGEQMGWVGIVIVCVCFFILVSRTTTAAQYSGNKFTFYLCLGLGLLMGVQFLFIALGCVGAIPLSGVPVPLLSYSGTSMIMALAAYGVVISISRHRGSPEALRMFVVNERLPRDDFQNTEAKSLVRNLIAGMLIFFVGSVCVVAFNGYYQLFNSGPTQIRQALTANNKGLRILEDNPRITQVMDRLTRGNIYDRNNLLLATSDADAADSVYKKLEYLSLENNSHKRLRRYYPFGANTVFITGDLNHSDVYANYTNFPLGYYAENENQSKLTGYKTNPEEVTVEIQNYKFNPFLSPVSGNATYRRRDYSELLPALSVSLYRNGWIDNFNAKREDRDIRLSVDAVLQTNMQKEMAQYIKEKFKNNQNLRASVVVLDATSGELLTSSNYPLANTDSIINLRMLGLDTKGGAPSEWRKGGPVTERDLGMTYMTPPGSTAKVMTAMAGFKKLGPQAYNRGFEIAEYMTVEPPQKEPNITARYMNRNGGKTTFMENAIKYSSNCYFIMLLNEENLYKQLGQVYSSVGASLARIPTYILTANEENDEGKLKFENTLARFETRGLADYDRYIHRTPTSLRWDYTNKNKKDRMSSIQEFTGIAWGQGKVEASPLTMARVAAIVVNGGELKPTSFLYSPTMQPAHSVIDSESAKKLASAMAEESNKHIANGNLPKGIKGKIGGKTGTPQSEMGPNKKRMNDGWYMCFIDDSDTGNKLAVAVRLERIGSATSMQAVHFTRDVILPVLKNNGYIIY